MIPIIMSGGSGTRLWPLSRKNRPKQFISLVNNRTMFQNTLDRLEGLLNLDKPIVVCNDAHRFMVADQLQASWATSSNIILEPVGRNTAPAIALAALGALDKQGAEAVLLVLSADHHIVDGEGFRRVIAEAETLAKQGKMVTFGIVPIEPETGYGYIKAGRTIPEAKSPAFSVVQFVEKPDLATAESYLASGDYYWNSGMFMFRADRYLEELKKYSPEIFNVCEQAFDAATHDLDFTRIPEDIFANCPDNSIDYAVMEKTDSAVVVPLDVGWSDVGSWSALWALGDKDASDNVCHGDVIHEDSEGCYFYSDDKLVTGLGLKDIVVVETADGVLVANKHKVQNIKKIVNTLKAAERRETEFHREVHRPWGVYDSIDNGDRYQVKRITVKPSAKLSVQMHHHRAEHWIVVSGTAKVLIGDKEQLLTENQSVYIPIGVVHSLGNPGKIPLEIIEVQSGAYLDEDDIVRFNDIYGRTE